MNLKTYFTLRQGTVRSVDGVDLTIYRGQTLGVQTPDGGAVLPLDHSSP